MKLSVARELKLPGKTSAAEVTEWWNDFGYLGREVRFAAPVTVRAEYAFDGSGFSVRGGVVTAFHSVCARCGREFTEPFETEFDGRFEKEADEESEAYPFAGEELDLGNLVRDAILLNMANYTLCKEDCRGLCPVCGCDLNTEQCSCARDLDEDETVNPFLQLRNLLEDDKEV
ncbi:MAG TPA: DUF177 domain-containing protein [Clostridia bacterium]|nr:DUF177 domain-containing protein [Clostridia bacterium]